jgi:hypothetical protein
MTYLNPIPWIDDKKTIVTLKKEHKMPFFEVMEDVDKKDLLPLTPAAKEIIGNLCGTSYPEVFEGDEFFVMTVLGDNISLKAISKIIELYEMTMAL